MNTTSSSRRLLLAAAAALALITSILPLTRVDAVEFPIPSSPLFFQTSGPEAGLGIGDWYTSSSGGGTDHVILLPVPDAWPATQPITIAIYDPESRGGSTGLATNDEVRGTPDATRFRLVQPGVGTIADQTFASSATYHGTWVELSTFLPVPGTTYELYSQTGVGATTNAEQNDDNSWRLSFTSDPDCTVDGVVGNCSGIESGNESDDADGTPGTGDELAMGFKRATYQYSPGSTVTFWYYVDSSVDPTVTLHNFDLDGNRSVTYTRADGSTVPGTVSGGTRWNNSTDSTRVGDVVTTNGSTGWWQAAVRANGNNQFIFEVDGQVPVYFAQPPTPQLAVSIDDSDLDIAEGEPHTYAINVDNVSDTSSAPGAAVDTVVTVPLPTGVVYDSCSAPAGISCSFGGGDVSFTLSAPLAAGADVDLSIDTVGGPGMSASVALTATARYEDQLGNNAAPVSATDTNATLFPDLAVTIGPDQSVAPGDPATFDVDVENLGSHIQPNSTVTVSVPSGLSVDGANTDAEWSCPGGATAPASCVWTLGTMSPSDSDSAQLSFMLPSSVGVGVESIDVTADTTGDYTEAVTANNTSTAAMTVDAVPDLAINVVPPATYVPGSQTGWSVFVENLGDQDASGVIATVTVPADADATPAAGWVCVPDPTTGSTCTYDIGELDAGQDDTVPFLVDTDPAAVDPATLPGTVTDDGTGGADSNLLNNSDDDTISPSPAAELIVDVSVTVDPVNIGDTTEFTVTVRNDGPSLARSVVAVVDVPPGLSGATPPSGCMVTATHTWTCVIGDLAPGASVTDSASGHAAEPVLTMTAVASSPTDPDGASDAATTHANRPPAASDGLAETEDRDPVTIDPPVTDPDGDALTVTVTAPEGDAVVTAGPTGPQIVYTPGPETAGTVLLTYEACDPDGLCDDAEIEVLVKRVFLAATAVCIADVPYLSYDATVVGVSGSPTAAVTWTDGVNVFTSDDLPLSGLALWPGAAVADASPAPTDRIGTDWPGWYTEDGIWVEGEDGFMWARGPLSVTIQVNPTSPPVVATYPSSTPDCAARPDGPANRPPVGTDLSGWASVSFPYEVDLIAGTTDPDGDTVTVTQVTPASGKASVNGGSFTYQPSAGESGTVRFTVEITDGRGGYDTFTVTIQVAPAREMFGVTYIDKDGDGGKGPDDVALVGSVVTVIHPGGDGVLGSADDVTMTTRTGSDGTWSIDDVPVGLVRVVVDAPGQATRTVNTTADYVPMAYTEELPVTGVDIALIAVLAISLTGAGIGAIGGTRRKEN